MTKKAFHKYRKIHKWLGLILGIYLIYMSITGILINHRDLTTGINVSSRWLPDELKIDKWEAGSLKSIVIEDERIYIGGKQGVFFSKDNGKHFVELKRGYPKNLYKKHTNKIARFLGKTVAINYDGLYIYSNGLWVKKELNTELKDLAVLKDSLYILTKDSFFVTKDLINYKTIIPKIPIDKKMMSSFAMFMFMVHNGSIGGFWGKIFIDVVAIILILVIITGFYVWFFAKNFKHIKDQKIRKKYANSIKPYLKFAHENHNKFGIYGVFFFLAISISGVFIASPIIFMTDEIPLKQFWDKKNQHHFPTGDFARFAFVGDRVVIARHRKDLFLGNSNFKEEFETLDLGVDFFFDYGNVFKGEDNKLIFLAFRKGVMGYDLDNKKISLLQKSKEFIVYDYFDFNNEKVIAQYRRGLISTTSNIVPFNVPYSLENTEYSLYQILFWLHKGKLFEQYLSLIGWWMLTLWGGILTTVSLTTGAFMWYYRNRKNN